MVDLPESMKTGGFDPQKAQAELEADRNRSRMQQQLAQSPVQVPGSGAGAGPTPVQAGPEQPGGAGQSPTPARGAQAAGAKPGSYAERRKAAKARKEQRQAKTADGTTKDYPDPITLRGFVAFGAIALSQDLTPLAFDLIGIGWIVEYIHLPITWIAYWYIIIRWAPRSMKKKFWQRTLLVTMVGWVPVVGQFIPEWTATAIGAYIVIARYQTKVSYEAAGRASKKQTKKVETATASANV